MQALRIATARLRALFRRDATSDEIREELEFHVQMRAEEYARHGMERDEARRAALQRFGNVAVVRDRGYDVRGGGLIETILQDVKYSLRQLRRQPSFSLVAVLTLALGIGVSTALFSIIDAALVRALPYPHPEQLVDLTVHEDRPGDAASRYAPSPNDIRAWRKLETIVSHVGMGRVGGFTPLIIDTGSPERAVVAEASEDFLETYGITPVLGRAFREDDTRPGAPRVALLGNAFWKRAYNADPGVLGRDIRVSNEPATIVGVLPAGFYRETAVWQASRLTPWQLEMRGSGTPVIARLRPGVTAAQAKAAFEAVAAPSRISGPQPAAAKVLVRSLYDEEVGDFGTTIRTLSLTVALIVIIACVNVGGLLLARGAGRQVELAIRAAIGAGRGRLVRQLLTESVMLAAGGAAVGVLIAYATLDSLVALVPLTLPANSPVEINGRVLACTLALTVLTAFLFGLVPALKLSGAPSAITSRWAVGGRAGTPLSKRSGQWLIGVEVALALILVSGAGLLLRSFSRLVSVDLGFDAAHAVTLEVEPLTPDPAARRTYYAGLVDSVRRLPEVESAGAIGQLALEGGGQYGFARADTGAGVEGMQHAVLPGYFEATGVRPLAGRLFEEGDRVTGDAVVANLAASRTYFAGNAVGHTLRTEGKTPRQLRIVGVVPDIRHSGPQADARPVLYMLPDPATTETSLTRMAILLRLRPGVSVPIERLKQTAESIGPRVLVERMRPLSALMGEQVVRPRHRMLLLTLLGGFGVLLTLVGIFSMTAYAVARRTREIGVRVAFGARPGQVVGTMLRDILWPVAIGIAAGLAGTYYATRVISSFLFATTPHDPGTHLMAVGLLAAAAALAAWLPARRATRVDPVTALRAE